MIDWHRGDWVDLSQESMLRFMLNPDQGKACDQAGGANNQGNVQSECLLYGQLDLGEDSLAVLPRYCVVDHE